MHEPTVIRLEEKLALQTAEHSINYENQMYMVGVPWKERQPVLPNNYDMALRRLENTEKRLKRSPDIADSYSKCIEQYIEKGYVRKIMEHEKVNQNGTCHIFRSSDLTKKQQKLGSYLMHQLNMKESL